MIKRFVSFFVFFFALSVLYGQNSSDPASQSQLDNAIKTLAAELQKKIPAGGNPKVSLRQWIYHDTVPALGRYWAAQLTEELTNVPGRSFVLVPGGPGASDWTVSGEIIENPGIIRVYTRLIRSSDQSIAASFHADFDRNAYFAALLSGGGGGSSSSIAQDVYEPDNFDNPLAVEIGANNSGPLVNRTIHAENDEDFFLLAPNADGVLTMETTGNSIDTYMDLYDAESGEEIDEDDDSGSGSNAHIQYEVSSGERYIVKIRGYGGDTGSYGFHAWLTEPVRMTPDEFENDNEFESAKNLSLGTAQRHTFTTGDDVDWVKFQISQAGSYTIRTRGVNSPELDTYIELYDDDRNAIDDDDDGGEDYDSRLSVRLQAGTYYLRVECLDSEPDQAYTIRVDREN
jgi:hypothetical protein